MPPSISAASLQLIEPRASQPHDARSLDSKWRPCLLGCSCLGPPQAGFALRSPSRELQLTLSAAQVAAQNVRSAPTVENAVAAGALGMQPKSISPCTHASRSPGESLDTPGTQSQRPPAWEAAWHGSPRASDTGCWPAGTDRLGSTRHEPHPVAVRRGQLSLQPVPLGCEVAAQPGFDEAEHELQPVCERTQPLTLQFSTAATSNSPPLFPSRITSDAQLDS